MMFGQMPPEKRHSEPAPSTQRLCLGSDDWMYFASDLMRPETRKPKQALGTSRARGHLRLIGPTKLGFRYHMITCRHPSPICSRFFRYCHFIPLSTFGILRSTEFPLLKSSTQRLPGYFIPTDRLSEYPRRLDFLA